MDRLNKVIGWVTWNDRLSVFILAAIIGLWVCDGRWIVLQGEVKGALIAVFTLITQYYFRKAPANGSSGTTTEGKPKQ